MTNRVTSRVRAAAVSAAVVFALGLGAPAAIEAQIPCELAGEPLCDGACPPGHDCEERQGACECQPTTNACGIDEGPPLCYGLCPEETPICADVGGTCTCVVPTLSGAGILGLSVLMLGAVLYRHRARAPRQLG